MASKNVQKISTSPATLSQLSGLYDQSMKTPDQLTPEEDPAWDLLENASQQTADPMFARNIMRNIRLEAAETKQAWWKSILAPRPALATLAAAACVAVAVISFNNNESPAPANEVADTATPTKVEEPTSNQLTASYEASAELDEIIDPLMLVTYTDESDPTSLEELGL